MDMPQMVGPYAGWRQAGITFFMHGEHLLQSTSTRAKGSRAPRVSGNGTDEKKGRVRRLAK